MRSLQHLAVALIATALSACAARPTQVMTTWKDPSATPLQFRKVLAIFVGGDATMRRQIENRLARDVPNTVASHTVIPDAELADTQRVRGRIAGGGYDGVVVLRLASVETRAGGETIPTMGDPSETLADYLRRSPRSALASGQETVIIMESRLYSCVTESWCGRAPARASVHCPSGSSSTSWWTPQFRSSARSGSSCKRASRLATTHRRSSSFPGSVDPSSCQARCFAGSSNARSRHRCAGQPRRRRATSAAREMALACA